MTSTEDAQIAGDAGTDVEGTKGKDGHKLEEVTGEEGKMAMEIDAGSSEAEISKPAEGASVGMDIDDKDEQKREEMVHNEEEQKAGVVVNPKKKMGRPSREKVEAEKAEEHVETDSAPADEGKETKKRGRKKRAELPIIPLLSDRDRPARERKSIDRFVASSLDKEKKEVVIKQGKGTPLMDIPNVAYKLGKRGKGDELLGMLHSLLFNQRGKASAHKYNIYRFSGFVWGENEEKEKNRVKEKLEKYTKEGLVQLIDVLDLHLPKTGKKEELVWKVLQFLESPHKTTDVSLGEKEQKLKEKKRKGRGPGRGRGSSTGGRKRRKVDDSTPKRGRGRKRKEESESEGGPTTEASSGDEDLEVEEVEEARLTYKESEEEEDDEDDEDYQAKKKLQRKGLKTPKIEVKEEVQEKTSQDEYEQGLKKSTSDFSLAVKTPSPDTDRNASKPPEKVYTKGSRKKNKEKEKEALEKEKEKEKTKQDVPERKRRGKDKERSKEKNSDKRTARVRETTKKKFTGEIPSDDVLQNEIRNILKDLNRADFSKVTFMDIVLQLQDKLNVDLSVEKAHVKLLIRQEVSRLAGEGTDEDAPSEADAPPEGEDEAHADETPTAALERKSPNSAPDRNNIDADSHAAEGSRDVSGETAAKGEDAAETCEAAEPTKDDQKEGQSRSSSAVAESPDDRAARTVAATAETVENFEGNKTEQKDEKMDSRNSGSPPAVEERGGEGGGTSG